VELLHGGLGGAELEKLKQGSPKQALKPLLIELPLALAS
jgi:hypothetical protein